MFGRIEGIEAVKDVIIYYSLLYDSVSWPGPFIARVPKDLPTSLLQDVVANRHSSLDNKDGRYDSEPARA